MTTQTVAARVEPVPEWAGLIHQSVDEVFDMMLGMKVAPCASNGFRYEVTSMVGLAGALCGLLMVRCSNETAANLTCRMLGTDSVDSQDDVHDALGEICNMVAGSFKSKIPGHVVGAHHGDRQRLPDPSLARHAAVPGTLQPRRRLPD